MSIEAGHYPDMPMDEYQGIDKISRSDIVRILQSPAHYKHHKEQGDVDKACYRFGRAAHCRILEGIVPTVNEHDGRSKIGKEFQAKNPDAIKPDEAETVKAMAKSLEGFRWGKEVEQSFFWYEGSILCGCRPDAVVDGYVWDFKTSRRNANQFHWDIKDYRYDIQAVWYLRGVQQQIPVCGFRFLVIEKEPPHGYMIYELNDLEQARQDIRYALELYGECEKTGVWPGYDEQVRRI